MVNKEKIKKILQIGTLVVGGAFVGTSVVAKIKKENSIYKEDKRQRNLLEGHKVIFVADENDSENADGACGHLESVGLSEYKPGIYEKYIKRAIDIMLSFGGLVVLSPIYLGISIAIIIDDPGPVLFTQKRMGKNKQYFKLHKFRSMKMSTPHDVPTHMLDNPEQYITRVGKFLRAHSLDELPQIWDIFIGNMSVIGPRPGLWNQDVLTAERDKYNANDVKPGLTGWAQINGRDELEIPEKAKLDGEYVAKIGLMMDIKCFLGSVGVFAHDDSVVEGGTGAMEEHEKKKNRRVYTDGKLKEEIIGQIGFGETVEVDTEIEKKVLITGKGSYIGENFYRYAKEHYPTLNIEAVDMLEPSWRKKDFSKYDVVYHVAGIAHADVGNVDETTKEKYYEVNTDLAVEVCEKAKAEGVKDFIFMSSMIVYGDSAPYKEQKIIDETTIPVPANFYGDSKLQADVAVRELADEKFKVIVLRPPMIYGKGSKGNYPKLAKLAKKLPIFPNVDNERSMLYIENLCEFLCQIMLVKTIKENSIVLIPQNSEWVKTSEMAKKIREETGKKVRTTGGIMKLAITVGCRIPGRIGGLVNKAFGNLAYAQSISEYPGVSYRIVDLNSSIRRSEGLENSMKEKFEVDATAIIMTKNEEKNIGDCLESMKGFAKRCVVIDCGSNDRTIEIAKEKGADVYFHEFEYYAQQFNWGIDNCDINTAWIIRLDADERFPEELKREVAHIINNDKVGNINGITIEADYYFLGKCMKHGLTNKRKMMMFKKSCGRIEDKRRDAHSIISEGVNVDAKHKFIHYDFKNLDAYIKRYNWYATREMQDYMEYINDSKGATYNGDAEIKKQRAKKYGVYYKAPKFLRAQLWFIYNYVFKRGFLDGKEGFLFLYFECYWYRMLVDAKIYEQMKTGNDFEELKALD